MSMHRAVGVIGLAMVGSVFTSSLAVSQQPRALGRPVAEHPEGFTSLSRVRELRDGRVVVVDPTESRLEVLSFESRSANPVGRKGSGPGEWLRPIAVYPWLADSSLVQDPGNSRFLILDPSGKPTRIIDPSQGPASRAQGTVRAIDARGNLYYEGSRTRLVGQAPQPLDSTIIARFHLSRDRHDTLGMVDLPVQEWVQLPTGGGGPTMRRLLDVPFSAVDDWTTRDDGTVVIARSGNYHLDLIRPNGQRVSGPMARFTPARVAEADRAAWRAANGERTAEMGGRTFTVPALPDPQEWPTVMPPFQVGGVWALPGAMTWVVRTITEANPVPLVDVFDDAGKWAGQVQLPPRSQVVGVGARHVYLARKDADDVFYLGKYLIP